MIKHSFHKYLLISTLIFLSYGCHDKSEIKKIVKEWHGKYFILPNDSLMINESGKRSDPLRKNIKIVTTINASCGVCISELKDWSLFMEEIDTSKVGFVFLLFSNDNLIAFNKLNKEIIHFSYPYFYDIRKQTILKNNLPESKLYQTLLLDSDNRVILIGNPIRNKDLSTLYKNEIDKNTSEQTTKLPGVQLVRQPNRVKLDFDKNITWQDEDGKKLSLEEVREMTEKNNCWLEQTSSTTIIVKKRRN